MKSTTANWHVELNVECPHCETFIDLMNYDEKEAFDFCSTEKDVDVEFCCPQCGQLFLIESTEF